MNIYRVSVARMETDEVFVTAPDRATAEQYAVALVEDGCASWRGESSDSFEEEAFVAEVNEPSEDSVFRWEERAILARPDDIEDRRELVSVRVRSYDTGHATTINMYAPNLLLALGGADGDPGEEPATEILRKQLMLHMEYMGQSLT